MTANLHSERVSDAFRAWVLALCGQRCKPVAPVLLALSMLTACSDGLAPGASLTWVRVPSGTSDPLYDVWGSAPGDVWAVGFNGTILHYDGSRWQRALEGVTHVFRGVWGSGRTNVWAVGTRGVIDLRPVIYHFDGQGWRSTPSVVDALAYAPLLDVWGTSANNVWAVGYGGTIIHFNGTSWSNRSIEGEINAEYVWGSPAGDAWIVGPRTVLRFNGQAWAGHASPVTDSLQLTAGWGVGPTDHWAGSVLGPLLHFDGARWSEVARDSLNLYGAWGSSRRDVWAVGESGVILHGTYQQ